MKPFIAGGARVSYHLARLLRDEDHDVAVLESDANQLEHIENSLGDHTIHGNAGDVQRRFGPVDAESEG